ncbi:MAG: hypothetical protein AAF850_09895 [Pseudomonadota bacterium]
MAKALSRLQGVTSLSAAVGLLLALSQAPISAAQAQTCLLDLNADGTATDGIDGAAGAIAPGGGAIACGPDGSDGDAFGAVASGEEAIAFGADATAGGDFAQAIGGNSSVAGDGGLALGDFATSAGEAAIAIGPGSNANGQDSIGLGRAASSGAPGAVAIGPGASANSIAGTALGAGADVSGSDGVAIGVFAASDANDAVAVGANARALAEGATAIGDDASASGVESFAGAENAQASGDNSIAIGSDADNDALRVGAVASGNSAIAIGADASAGFDSSVALGPNATTTRTDQIVVGADTSTITATGITSASSRAAQSGAVELVTADAGGNLATDGGATAAQITANTLNASTNSAAIADLNNQFANFDQNMSALRDAIAANEEDIREANNGVALAMAMAGSTWLQQNESFAVSGNWGNYAGSNGMAFSAAARLSSRASLNAGVGVATRTGQVGARAGLRFGW